MATTTTIEWTEETWNPVTGCCKVSAGCANCYAEKMAHRLKAMGAVGYDNGFELTLLPERLQQPFRKKKPTRFFVNSMSDLFHEDVPDKFLDDVFAVMRQTPQHTYQILTKRAYRLPQYFGSQKLPSNIWLGVTVEDRQSGIPRIDHLRNVDAAIRFLSVEPLLEDLGKFDLTDIHWVIVGGESGPNARPMNQDWVLSIKEQCEKSGSAFFFKQWGTWGIDRVKRNKKANGRLLLGQTWNAYPKQELAVNG
ncbi:MAG: phage Gp37/Gp68 family protein [Desulfuromonadaceae bacterium]|nr:phage Gp37/Gp68 family protein [Desulfuromonadaceae bacterium]